MGLSIPPVVVSAESSYSLLLLFIIIIIHYYSLNEEQFSIILIQCYVLIHARWDVWFVLINLSNVGCIVNSFIYSYVGHVVHGVHGLRNNTSLYTVIEICTLR